MISDVLADAVAEIDAYLDDSPEIYEPGHYMMMRVRQVAVAMDELRAVFDMDIRLSWPTNDDEYADRLGFYRHLERQAARKRAPA